MPTTPPTPERDPSKPAPSTVRRRVKLGMSPEQAAIAPVRRVDLEARIGAEHGLLTIERYAGKNSRGFIVWECSCR